MRVNQRMSMRNLGLEFLRVSSKARQSQGRRDSQGGTEKNRDGEGERRRQRHGEEEGRVRGKEAEARRDTSRKKRQRRQRQGETEAGERRGQRQACS